jgi:hypothetical protein
MECTVRWDKSTTRMVCEWREGVSPSQAIRQGATFYLDFPKIEEGDDA